MSRKGFTIVELLIVVVVIAILAAITIVAYNGIQNRSKNSAVDSTLRQAASKIESFAVINAGAYPASLAEAEVTPGSNVNLQYIRGADSRSFCVTATYGSFEFPKNFGSSGSITQGPCSGHNAGPNWCPTDTYVPINGFYCQGNENSVATLNNVVVKLAANASGVPAGAPGAFVGRQQHRDNYLGAQFDVSPGQQYCMEGWAATSTSTVGHAIGLQFYNGTSNSWVIASRVLPNTTAWQKIEGCITVPAGIVRATVWSQNDGAVGSTADAPWYQTAVKFWRVS